MSDTFLMLTIFYSFISSLLKTKNLGLIFFFHTTSSCLKNTKTWHIDKKLLDLNFLAVEKFNETNRFSVSTPSSPNLLLQKSLAPIFLQYLKQF